MIGTTVAHYTITEKIGAGGMGEVYLARDLRLGREVAIKVLAPRLLADPNARARLLREAITASALNHPNICTVHDVGETDESAYIVMEHIVGRPLDTMIPATGLDPPQVIEYGRQITGALAHAHGHGVVHRDLKSGNVVVTADGLAKILDFGLARRLDLATGDATRNLETLTAQGAISGTPAYMAPEVLRGDAATPATDVWAAGVLLYEMAAGTLPFRGRTAFEMSSAIMHEPHPPLPDVIPPALRAVIDRCLTKDTGGRYHAGGELQAALDAVASGSHPAPSAAEPAKDDATIGSLAVLPLHNLSGDPSQEFFADGMTEAITADLAKIKNLRVISRTSAMQYKGSAKTLPVIAGELRVDAVVEGSILRAGDRVRITAQLIRAATDEHLWAESYDGNLTDLLDLQSTVSGGVAEAVRGTLSPQDRKNLAAPSRQLNPEAHDAYLRGRHFWQQRSFEALLQAIEHYRQAIEREPTYALAYVGIAECYCVIGFQGGMSPMNSFVPGAAAARRALELDSSLAEAYISLAYASLFFDRDWSRIEADFKRGIELNPNYATGHHWYALYLVSQMRREEAMAELRTAWELDPLAPIIRTAMGWSLYFFGAHDEADSHYQAVLEVNPDFPPGLQMRGLLRVAQGRADEGVTLLRRVSSLYAGQPLLKGALGYALARAGHTDEARSLLGDLQAQAGQRYIRPYEFAAVHAGLGETDEAIRHLEKALEEGGNWLAYLRLDPVWESLRGEPRFQAIVSRVFASP